MTRLDDSVTPHNLEAEKAVLGSVLLHPEQFPAVADIVAPDEFFRAAHETIFRAMSALHEQHRSIDVIPLTEHLRALHLLEDPVGGPAYITSLVDGFPPTTHAESYAAIVHEHAVRRRIVAAMKRTAVAACDVTVPIDLVIDDAQRQLIAESTRRGAFDVIEAPQLAESGYAMLQTLMQDGGGIHGVPTGFTLFDAMTRGLPRGMVTVVGARPSMGKSAFALNAAYYAATHGFAVAFFSLEMSQQEILLRLLADVADINGHDLGSGTVREAEYPRLGEAVAQIGASEFRLIVNPDLGIVDLRRQARRIKSKAPLDLVVIDYLQLLRTSVHAENRNIALAEVTRALKVIAGDLDVAVLALSQLSRGVDQRESGVPRLADLRDSGAIEQDADVVVFIHRPAGETKVAELIVAKQRNGPVGTARIGWRPERTRFENLEALDV